MTSELRIDTRSREAFDLLRVMDTSNATDVMKNWHEIVILFDVSEDVLANRVLAADAVLQRLRG